MADVKWIKIMTDIFDDEKILLIEGVPVADSIIVIWFKLLTLAGKQNNDGVFIMSNRIAYTDEMLATIFRRDLKLVRLALTTFERFGMIEIVDSVITIPNWNRHQTLDSYEKRKERDRIYQAERREQQKTKAIETIKKSTDSSSDVVISDIEVDKIRIDKDKDKDSKVQKHKYGAYQHVLLADDEMNKLINELGNELYTKCITYLDEYIEMKGYKAKSHYLCIKKWVVNAVHEKEQKKSINQQPNDFAKDMEEWANEREGIRGDFFSN